jgi:hypothetical protein
MTFLKKSLVTLAVLFGTAIVLGLARELANSSGIILGAIPTVLIMLPAIVTIQRTWFRGTSKKKRAELASALRQMIDDPNTAPEQRQQAIDRLAQLEGVRL